MSDVEKLKKLLIHQHEGDEQQLSVIFTEMPRVIVEAPAGYGKTTTMISRIAYLFASGQIPNPKKVLGLTFSVNAALKVKRDVAEKLPGLMGVSNNPTLVNDKVTVTNYHGFCKGVLKKYGYLITDLLRKDVNTIKAIGDTEVRKYPEINTLLTEDEKNILEKMNHIIKTGNFPEGEVLERYDQLVIQKMIPLGYITHNAIILMTISLFSSFQEIKKFYQNYYPLLIVDEFQDTNSIAWNLLEHLISPKSQLLFLGDPLQRIYGFIGALPNVMSVAADKYDMQLISLSQNYRFKTNPEMLKLDANIRVNSEKLFEFKPDVRMAQLPAFYGVTQENEAVLIASKIADIQKYEPNCKIAILCRGRNINSEIIEHALATHDIPYFYGMFTDEDQDYIDFHFICQNLFVQRFGKRRNLGSYSLKAFVESIKDKYANASAKINISLLSLLDALIKKVSTEYVSLTPEDKYSLILDIFENRQLKQAMEYVDENIVMSTIHGAKGLEWEYVFLADVERWVFPNYFTCNECSHRFDHFEDCKCKMTTPVEMQFQTTIIDELSVFYVGVTRARKQAYISASAKRYNSYNQKKDSGFSCLAAMPGIQLINAKA